MYTEIANHNYKGNRQIFNKQVKGQVKGLFIPLPLALASVIESDILTMNFWYDGRESPRLKKIFDFNYTCSPVRIIFLYILRIINILKRTSQQKQEHCTVLITCTAWMYRCTHWNHQGEIPLNALRSLVCTWRWCSR